MAPLLSLRSAPERTRTARGRRSRLVHITGGSSYWECKSWYSVLLRLSIQHAIFGNALSHAVPGLPRNRLLHMVSFFTKLEARMRFAGFNYTVEQGSMRTAPRGKIPYVAITEDEGSRSCPPVVIGDSKLIMQTLVQRGFLPDLDAHLLPAEKLHDLALKALVEDKLYFYQMYEKWILNFYTMRSKILAALPWPVQVVVGHLIYRKVSRTLNGQGTMTFSVDEIGVFRQEIWEGINAAVLAAQSRSGNHEGLFWIWAGEARTETDAVLFGFIVSGAPDSQRIIRSFPALMEYARKIHDRYFPNYDLWNEAETVEIK
ncbi:uncharacterized protein ATNIH1004_001910 [Aspergillus tanneri]|uniref:Thioredoxin-like fold domain-containing protein n=1 Tax=Aspergillus tanneri TaxID=1220188 RepID=A0A5M9M385_9EURO|nr:uncharacterized protein ATNIH1004_001910 [Aspergillus tanneri]KAA8641445.1 hypothetical protein ATNIH1004_001910 [Aspergillus tanneri]